MDVDDKENRIPHLDGETKGDLEREVEVLPPSLFNCHTS